MKKYTISLLAGVAALGFASAGYAADLIVEAPVVTPGVVSVSGNWDGAYIGAFIGAGWGTADHIPGPGFPGDPEGNDLDLSGWLVGVNAGVNFTLSEAIVAGIVGDIAWTNISGTDDFGLFGDIEHTINWQGSIRGRLGFDGGAFLPYVTGGLAFANATRTSLGPDTSADATHIGWTVGAGVEFAVADNASIDLLYRFSDYGEQEYDYGSSPTIDLQTHTLQVGLNWRF